MLRTSGDNILKLIIYKYVDNILMKANIHVNTVGNIEISDQGHIHISYVKSIYGHDMDDNYILTQ